MNGLFLLIGFVWFFLALGVGYNAENNGRGGFGWFFLVLITGIFGLLYYVAKSPSRQQKRLERRVSELESNADYCPKCGSKLKASGCSDCGYSRPVSSEVGGGETQSNGPSFIKVVSYTAAIVISFIIGSLASDVIATALSPYQSYSYGSQIYEVSRTIHVSIGGIVGLFSMAIIINGLLLCRSKLGDYTVTNQEKNAVAGIQTLISLYFVGEMPVLVNNIQTLPQIMTVLSLIIAQLGITGWLILDTKIWGVQPRLVGLVSRISGR